MLKTWLNLQSVRNHSALNVTPDQILLTHSYCFPFNPPESSRFYLYHPLQPLPAEFRCLRRMQEEWRTADLSAALLVPLETSVFLLRLRRWDDEAGQSVFRGDGSLSLVERWHLFERCLWQMLGHSCFPTGPCRFHALKLIEALVSIM